MFAVLCALRVLCGSIPGLTYVQPGVPLARLPAYNSEEEKEESRVRGPAGVCPCVWRPGPIGVRRIRFASRRPTHERDDARSDGTGRYRQPPIISHHLPAKQPHQTPSPWRQYHSLGAADSLSAGGRRDNSSIGIPVSSSDGASIQFKSTGGLLSPSCPSTLTEEEYHFFPSELTA